MKRPQLNKGIQWTVVKLEEENLKMATTMCTVVVVTDQSAAKQMKPGHCTKSNPPWAPWVA